MNSYPTHCPECNSTNLEDNGCRADEPDLTMLCVDCAWQWTPYEDRINEDWEPEDLYSHPPSK